MTNANKKSIDGLFARFAKATLAPQGDVKAPRQVSQTCQECLRVGLNQAVLNKAPEPTDRQLRILTENSQGGPLLIE